MNKYLKYLMIGSVILALFLLIYFVLIKNNDSDAVRFSKEYTSVEKNNVFVYKEPDEIIKILKNGTGIVYLGFPECPWCNAYVSILNEVAKQEGIEKIYYCNVKTIREKNTKEYKEMVKILDKNLLYNEEGERRIFVPDITFVNKGEIVMHDNETSVVEEDIKPEEYWTKEKKEALQKKLKEGIKLISDDMCTSCNK